MASTGAALGMIPGWRPFGGAIPAGGLLGVVLADFLVANLNLVGAVIVTMACWIVALYLVSTFEVARLKAWLAGPMAVAVSGFTAALAGWRERRALRAKEKAEQRALRRAMKAQQQAEEASRKPRLSRGLASLLPPSLPSEAESPRTPRRLLSIRLHPLRNRHRPLRFP